ncbi:hypothetical protein IKF03_02490 [Candidatus Saccharibacteria bacterium]|nr:hypothetical protein [Candidatus Saccharibacteria bacterium]
MLKVVVFDSGFGGELFADYLENELPIVEVIRVIDWRNADKVLKNSRSARKVAEQTLRPYINQVDLIIFANNLLSLTSLRYFRRKYKTQKFIGLPLESPSTFIKKDVLILATSGVAKTINFHNFNLRLHRKSKTLVLDSWLSKIDDGELSFSEIRNTLKTFLLGTNFSPQEIILACSHLNDIKPELKNVFGAGIKIYDGFKIATRQACKTLNLRGGNFRKKKK